MESAKVEQLRKHIDECKSILAENNPRIAAEQIEIIGQAYYNEDMDFGIRPTYDKFGNTIYETSENLKKLKCLITQMEFKLAQWADEYNIKQICTNSPIINNIQLGSENKISNSNIGNNINIKNPKEKSIFQKLTNFFVTTIAWFKG